MRSLALLSLATLGFAAATANFMQAEPESFSSTDLDNVSCLLYDEMTVFNLKPLERSKTDGGYLKNGYRFNFCKRFNISDFNNAGKYEETYIYLEKDVSVVPPSGIPMSNSLYPKRTETVDEFVHENGVEEPRHLKIAYRSDHKCKDNSFEDDVYWETEFEIFCDSNG